MSTTIKEQLSQAREQNRNYQKQNLLLKSSKDQFKAKNRELAEDLKNSKKRVEEARASRNKWKAQSQQLKAELEQQQRQYHKLSKQLGIKEEELTQLRLCLAEEKKSARTTKR